MRALLFICLAFLSLANTNALAYLSSRAVTSALPTREIVQFPNETWLENMVVRENGQILVTLLNAPDLFQVDPFRPGSAPTLVQRIPGATSLLGIVEMQTDVFYIIAGNVSIAPIVTTPGSYSVWEVDMRARASGRSGASKVADIAPGVLLNGMAVLNETEGLLVVGDAGAGVVFTLNVRTGVFAQTMDDPTMQPVAGLGIDGMKIRGGFLYYSSVDQDLFCRIPVNSADGTPAGAATVIVRNIFVDDLSFDEAGNAYVAQNPDNTVAKITPDGIVTVIAGNLNSTLVAGATATGFGRTSRDRSVLYVTTTGGLLSPVNGTFIEGGKVVAILT